MTSTFTTYGTTRILRVLTVTLVLALTSVHVVAQPAQPAQAAQDADTGEGVPVSQPGLATRIGWQTEYEGNVYRSVERPVSDIVSTLSAGTELRGQLGRVGLSTSGDANWVHFDKLVGERGAEGGATLKLDFLFTRIVPYIRGSYGNSRRRLSQEIDTRPRSAQSGVVLGSVFRIGGKTEVEVSAGRSMHTYDRNAVADGVSLGAALNRATDHVALSFHQQVTPVTRFTITGDSYRDRYRVSSSRSAHNIRVTTGFESSGRINGAARVGIRILKPRDPSLPESRGLFVSLNTNATVLDRVQIGLEAQRDVEPSYRQSVAYYKSYTYGASFTYAMFRSVRLSARVGRRFADYRASGGAVTSAGDQEGVDKETIYGSSIGYQLGESVGIDFSGGYAGRTSTSASRRFNGANFGAGISYAF